MWRLKKLHKELCRKQEKGDKVATKQIIGTIYSDTEDDNKSILKFQIWQENQKLDPEDWIGN